jgi:hypothetical protein
MTAVGKEETIGPRIQTLALTGREWREELLR